jgi:hypothetical protein
VAAQAGRLRKYSLEASNVPVYKPKRKAPVGTPQNTSDINSFPNLNLTGPKIGSNYRFYDRGKKDFVSVKVGSRSTFGVLRQLKKPAPVIR